MLFNPIINELKQRRQRYFVGFCRFRRVWEELEEGPREYGLAQIDLKRVKRR
jgi:hypothetical protein